MKATKAKLVPIAKKARAAAAADKLNNKEMVEVFLELLLDAGLEMSTEQPQERDGSGLNYYEKERIEKAAISEYLQNN